ncbi:hypothetical protein Hanom_Chr13g01183211 [Helianthus anomalus]
MMRSRIHNLLRILKCLILILRKRGRRDGFVVVVIPKSRHKGPILREAHVVVVIIIILKRRIREKLCLNSHNNHRKKKTKMMQSLTLFI